MNITEWLSLACLGTSNAANVAQSSPPFVKSLSYSSRTELHILRPSSYERALIHPHLRLPTKSIRRSPLIGTGATMSTRTPSASPADADYSFPSVDFVPAPPVFDRLPMPLGRRIIVYRNYHQTAPLPANLMSMLQTGAAQGALGGNAQANTWNNALTNHAQSFAVGTIAANTQGVAVQATINTFLNNLGGQPQNTAQPLTRWNAGGLGGNTGHNPALHSGAAATTTMIASPTMTNTQPGLPSALQSGGRGYQEARESQLLSSQGTSGSLGHNTGSTGPQSTPDSAPGFQSTVDDIDMTASAEAAELDA